jgi:hypothetical protein
MKRFLIVLLVLFSLSSYATLPTVTATLNIVNADGTFPATMPDVTAEITYVSDLNPNPIRYSPTPTYSSTTGAIVWTVPQNSYFKVGCTAVIGMWPPANYAIGTSNVIINTLVSGTPPSTISATYIPYTGSIKNVDLGTYNLTTTGKTTTGTFKLTTGAGTGYLLMSDADGDASWAAHPAEADTLDSVCDRGATTNQIITIDNTGTKTALDLTSSFFAFYQNAGEATEMELEIAPPSTLTSSQFIIFPNASGTVWTSGNDGTGSGLDADTVDGSTPLFAEADTLAAVVARGNTIPVTTPSNTASSVIYKGATPFLHDIDPAIVGGVNPDGLNTFLGINAGNFTMGSTATETYHASENTGVGYYALNSLTVGYDNTALGKHSMLATTTGSKSTAVGAASLAKQTSGSHNTALGYSTLYQNISGNDNTAIGAAALNDNTASYNTGIGFSALKKNVGGTYQTALGSQAGMYYADGSPTTETNTTSDYSVYLGANTRASADNAQNEIVIGYDAVGTGSNTATIGNTSIDTAYVGQTHEIGTLDKANTWTGTQSFSLSPTCSSSVYPHTGTVTGTLVGTTWTDVSATWGNRQWIGSTFTDSNGTATSVTNSTANTLTLSSGVDVDDGTYTLVGIGNEAFGNGSLNRHEGNYQTAMGFYALNASTGYANTAYGYMANGGGAGGYSNTTIGVSAGKVISSGYFNLAAGVEALNANTVGHNNVALGGYDAMFKNVDGNNNTCVGYGVMPAATTGEGNVMVGAGAGSLLNDTVAHDEDFNVFIGYTAGDDQTKGSNNILIGKDVQAASTTGSNQLNIGNVIKAAGIDAPTTSMTTFAGNVEAASFQSIDYDLKISFTSAPAIRFSNEAGTGDRQILASNLADSNNYTRVGGSASGLEMYSSGVIKWSEGATYSGTKDVGLARSAAGVLKVTDGSTGMANILSNGYLVPLVAVASNYQVGMIMTASPAGGFAVNPLYSGTGNTQATGGMPIGILTGTGATTSTQTYYLAMGGLAYVAPEEDQPDIDTTMVVVQSAVTAGYALFDATINANVHNTEIGHPIYSEAKITIASLDDANDHLVMNSSPAWAIGDPVIYWNSGDTSITGLTEGYVYWLTTGTTGTDMYLAATKGGAKIAISGGTFTEGCYLQRLPKCIIHWN